MKGESKDLDKFFQTTRINLEKMIESTISDKKISSLLTGGKRVRPLLSQLTFKACNPGKENSTKYQKSLEVAVCIELIHTASLVHDYIIDKRKKRRPSFQIEGGIDAAILLVHKILAIGFNIALKHGDDSAKLYVDTWDEILTGELKKIEINKKTTKKSFSERYADIIDHRLSALFSSACKAGAIEADMSGDILKVFAEYGREIGLAHQLAIDLVDLEKGEIKNKQVKILLDALKNKYKKSLKGEDIKELFICEIKKHVKIAETLSRSKKIPPSPYKKLLEAAPSYIINERLKLIKISI